MALVVEMTISKVNDGTTYKKVSFLLFRVCLVGKFRRTIDLVPSGGIFSFFGGGTVASSDLSCTPPYRSSEPDRVVPAHPPYDVLGRKLSSSESQHQ